MMKPKTMNTRMMVPATATTAMMMTGFCSLDTAVAAKRAEAQKHCRPRRTGGVHKVLPTRDISAIEFSSDFKEMHYIVTV